MKPSPQHILWLPTVAVSSASLFLPAAGYCNDTSRNNAGDNGNYWSRSLNDDNPNNAWNLNFNEDDQNVNNNNRNNGFSVRPVRVVAE